MPDGHAVSSVVPWAVSPAAELAELRSVAVAVAGHAAALVAEMRSAAVIDAAVMDVDTKSTETNVVTAADRASERLIRARLAELRPGEPVLGEEDGASGDESADGVC
jgi:myo-inositol-1(or 4)-monophosphatase